MTDEELQALYRSCLANSASMKKAAAGGVHFRQQGDDYFLEVETLKDKLQKMYLSYLESEGYKASIDKDGDVVFKYEGGYYYIEMDTSNNESGRCFIMIYPNFWTIENEEERGKALAAANEVNRGIKTGRVYITAHDTCARVAFFLYSPEQFKDYFHRAMGALQSLVFDFRMAMRKSEDA